MPDVQAMSLAESLAIATARKTALAGGDVLLFKSGFNPTPASVIADYEAEECDFSGYARMNVAAMLGPFLGLGGYQINTPLTNFAVAAGGVTNEVGGMALILTDETIVAYVTFETPINMSVEGQSLQRPIALLYPTGP